MRDLSRGVIGLVLVIVVIVVMFTAGNDTEGATKTLQAAGYSHIQMTGYQFLACDKEYFFRVGFKALGPTEKPASGVVCGKLFPRQFSIRLDGQ